LIIPETFIDIRVERYLLGRDVRHLDLYLRVLCGVVNRLNIGNQRGQYIFSGGCIFFRRTFA
jgi:hypothetical protein